MVTVRVIFAADEETDCTRAVVEYLRGVATVELLPASADWPGFAGDVGRRVAAGEFDRGVVMCWTGTGTCIAANKVPGARAALAWEPWIAQGARRWNDANVLAMSHKRLAPDVAVECAKAFLETTEIDPEEVESIDVLRGL
jgi:ribose 5-phosphate isomerase B